MKNTNNLDLIIELPDGGVCPVRTVQKLFEGKWKFIILYHLRLKSTRFNELKRIIPNISHGVLSLQLKELERMYMINRKVYNEVPPKVEYSLSETGEKFLPAMDVLIDFAKDYLETHNIDCINFDETDK